MSTIRATGSPAPLASPGDEATGARPKAILASQPPDGSTEPIVRYNDGARLYVVKLEEDKTGVGARTVRPGYVVGSIEVYSPAPIVANQPRDADGYLISATPGRDMPVTTAGGMPIRDLAEAKSRVARLLAAGQLGTATDGQRAAMERHRSHERQRLSLTATELRKFGPTRVAEWRPAVAPPKPVADMNFDERFYYIKTLAWTHLGADARAQVLEIVQPANLAKLAAFSLAAEAANALGVGVAGDIVMGGTAIKQVTGIGRKAADVVRMVNDAKDVYTLNQAGNKLVEMTNEILATGLSAAILTGLRGPARPLETLSRSDLETISPSGIFSGIRPKRPDHDRVVMLTRPQAEPYRLDIRDGRLIDRNGQAFDTAHSQNPRSGPGTTTFVLDNNGNLYAGLPDVVTLPSGELRPSHHTSYVNKDNVLLAGELKTDASGKVVQISNRSGHYRPSRAQFVKAVKYLQSLGLDIGETVFQIRKR